MTEDEKRQQKAMLLLEYHEAEQNLAHLEVSAGSVSQRLAAVSEWLEHASKRHNSLHDEFYSSKASKPVNILQDSQIPIAMNFDAAVKLVQEIRDGRKQVDELYKRKQSLGIN